MSKHSKESKDFLKKVEKMMKSTWEGLESGYTVSLYLWVFDFEDACIYRYDITNIKFDFTNIHCFDEFLTEQGHDLEECEIMLTDQSNFYTS